MGPLQNIPKPLLALIVFIVGIAFIVYTNKPHSICDSQIESLTAAQVGYLFPMPVKNAGMRPAFYAKTLENCKMGQGTAGACYEFFKILRRLNTDLEAVSPSCGETLNEVAEVKRAFVDGISIMVQMAWGETPPEKGEKVTGSLDAPDIALYCKLRDNWYKFFGQESFEKFKDFVFDQLSTRKFETDNLGVRTCTNCEALPKAIALLGGREEVFIRSLFALNCSPFR